MNTVSDEAILKKLVSSEAGQAAKAAIERDYTAERMNYRSQAEALRKERGEKVRAANDDAEAARQRLEAARATLTAADNAHRQAVMLQKQTAAHYDSRVKALQNKLRATAPAAINEFIEWLGDQESEAKATPIIENATKTNRISTRSGELIREVFSNAKSLDARLKVIRAARQEAEQLKSRIMDADELNRRLEELGNLPEVTMEYSHER